jgi:hypothetical protein
MSVLRLSYEGMRECISRAGNGEVANILGANVVVMENPAPDMKEVGINHEEGRSSTFAGSELCTPVGHLAHSQHSTAYAGALIRSFCKPTVSINVKLQGLNCIRATA